MNVAVCYNLVPHHTRHGESVDRIAEQGAEHEAKAVAEALVGFGHQANLLALGDDITRFADELRSMRPDLVFNLCEAFWGDSRKEMHVAALFDLLGLVYTGAPPLSLGLTQDKLLTKDLLVRHQLPTPRYCLVKPGYQAPTIKEMVFPMIVKPRWEDASQGISHESVVENPKALHDRIGYIHRTYRQAALVEEFIEGREINVALLGNDSPVVLPLSEIIFHPDLARPIVSFEGKWLEQSQHYRMTEPVCPAPLKSRNEMLVRDVALRAYNLLECRDYARVDIRLRDGVPYILEVNANPDISPEAGLARSAAAAEISYPLLIERILTLAGQRKK